MAYPLIILGAGASHDYSTIGKPIAPLTNHLVDDNFLHSDLLKKYEGSGNLISEIIGNVRSNKKTFEQVLTEVKKISENNEQMKKHFVALEFYLRDLFERVSTWDTGSELNHQVNNYRTLLNRLDLYTKGKACIVSFNYDSLLERNITRFNFDNINHYINTDCKVFKLHGSWDWSYIRRKNDIDPWGDDFSSSFDYCMRNFNFLDKLKTNNQNELLHRNELKNRDDFVEFPALAIPLNDKDLYVCPKNHITALYDELTKIDRILIIGWKAGDPLLLKSLQDNVQLPNCTVCVVSKTIEGVKQTIKNIRDIVEIPESSFIPIVGGFSEFMNNEASHTFFTHTQA